MKDSLGIILLGHKATLKNIPIYMKNEILKLSKVLARILLY